MREAVAYQGEGGRRIPDPATSSLRPPNHGRPDSVARLRDVAACASYFILEVDAGLMVRRCGVAIVSFGNAAALKKAATVSTEQDQGQTRDY
jgi:hypothetical protein